LTVDEEATDEKGGKVLRERDGGLDAFIDDRRVELY
jgi:hypothetical protein